MAQDYTFPDDSGVSFGYQILYRPVNRSYYPSITPASRYSNQFTLTGLIVGETYEVTVRIGFRVSSCYYTSAYGKESDATNFTTVYLRMLLAFN